MKSRILLSIVILSAALCGAALTLTLPLLGKTVLLLENQTTKPFHYIEMNSSSGEFHRIAFPLVAPKEIYKVEPLQRADSFVFRVVFEDKTATSSKAITVQLGEKKRIALADSGFVISAASFWDIIRQRNAVIPGRIIAGEK